MKPRRCPSTPLPVRSPSRSVETRNAMTSFQNICALSIGSAALAFLFGLPEGAMAEVEPMQTPAPTHQHGGVTKVPLSPFIATNSKPFSGLMDDAMNVMNDGMAWRARR